MNLEDPGRFNPKVLDYLKASGVTFRSFDASGAAYRVGSIMSTNIVLIGYSVGTGLVPFKHEDLKNVLESVSQKKNLEINLKAFEIGVREGKP